MILLIIYWYVLKGSIYTKNRSGFPNTLEICTLLPGDGINHLSMNCHELDNVSFTSLLTQVSSLFRVICEPYFFNLIRQVCRREVV